jgi:hypothetical protein
MTSSFQKDLLHTLVSQTNDYTKSVLQEVREIRTQLVTRVFLFVTFQILKIVLLCL